jgi:replicative DNA helicase
MFQISNDLLKLSLNSRKNKFLNFGISYLDAAAGPIMSNDLIIISSKSGKGKTSLASTILSNIANTGKTVYYFALEAFYLEIHHRIAYEKASQQYFKDKGIYPRVLYHEYLIGKEDDDFKLYIDDAHNFVSIMSKNLNVFYRRESEFTIEHFERKLLDIKPDTSLILIDHLHYFDYDKQNEYRELGNILKKIQDMVQILNIPIILISHINRSMRGLKAIVPDQEDLHGSSDIAKIASKIIFMANGEMEDATNLEMPTLFRIAKNRWNGSVCNYVGGQSFNTITNKYSDNFVLYYLKNNDTELEKVNEYRRPRWSR